MMTMRERIARALCACSGDDPDDPWADHGMDKGVPVERQERRWTMWLDEADAVLDAMREPTGLMIVAGEHSAHGHVTVADIFTAMIDAAKEEK